jgi:transposase-like protein
MPGLHAGVDYPRSDAEFQSWFGTDADCLDYLEWLRWPEGYVCPKCVGAGAWLTADGRFKCAQCGTRTSITAGTLFDRRRTPLTVWFEACWMFATQKDGVSALSLARSLEIGSYQTAWAMLHRLRSALVRPGRERLSGVVEVDETVMGGTEAALSGGRCRGKKKSLVAVAVERKEPKGFGRCRMAPIPDASSETLRSFLLNHVEEGSTVVTDGWQAYRTATRGLYTHQRLVVPGKDASHLMPGVH